MPITPKEMIRKLRRYGFRVVSQNGSHVKLYNDDTRRTVIIPYHTKDLKTGLEKAIYKQAGIEEE